MLPRGTAHQQFSGGIIGLHLHDLGLVHQHAVGNDLGLQTGSAEPGRDILSGLLVFRRRSHVGLGSEDLQVLAGQLCVGYGEEFFLDLGLRGEVAVAEDGRGRLSRQQCGAQRVNQGKSER